MEIVITQDDIREVQKAKGAFLAGARLLFAARKLKQKDIDQILIAGAFGTYIRAENARFIGLIPDLNLDKINQIGNAAGAGARALLMNSDLRLLAEKLPHTVRFVEIANEPAFSREYAYSMIFPHHDIDLFPSVKEEYENIPYR